MTSLRSNGVFEKALLFVSGLVLAGGWVYESTQYLELRKEAALRPSRVRAHSLVSALRPGAPLGGSSLTPSAKRFALLYFTRATDCREVAEEAAEVAVRYHKMIEVTIVPIGFSESDLAQYKASLHQSVATSASWGPSEVREYHVGRTPHRILLDLREPRVVLEGDPSSCPEELEGFVKGLRRWGE